MDRMENNYELRISNYESGKSEIGTGFSGLRIRNWSPNLQIWQSKTKVLDSKVEMK